MYNTHLLIISEARQLNSYMKIKIYSLRSYASQLKKKKKNEYPNDKANRLMCYSCEHFRKHWKPNQLAACALFFCRIFWLIIYCLFLIFWRWVCDLKFSYLLFVVVVARYWQVFCKQTAYNSIFVSCFRDISVGDLSIANIYLLNKILIQMENQD